MNKQAENKVPEDCLKLERWQGPPYINKVKEYTLCCRLTSICLFSLFCHENKESLISLFVYRKKSANEDLSLLIHTSSTKLQSAPLKQTGDIQNTEMYMASFQSFNCSLKLLN